MRKFEKKWQKNCLMCGEIFKTELSPNNKRQQKYCGRECAGKAFSGENNPSYKHGQAGRGKITYHYRIHSHIKERCLNKNNPDYPNYGGRGIKICDRWLGENGLINFIEDMGARPSNKYSIDRIDVNGDYEPSNCRWATQKEQTNNMRKNIFIEWQGEIKTMSQWVETHPLGKKLRTRRDRGWTVEEMFTIPAGCKVSDYRKYDSLCPDI